MGNSEGETEETDLARFPMSWRFVTCSLESLMLIAFLLMYNELLYKNSLRYRMMFRELLGKKRGATS